MQQPQLIVLDTLESIRALQEYLKDFDIVAYDCETTGVHANAQVIGVSICAEDDKAFYIISHKWDVASQSLIPSFPNVDVAVRELLILLKDKSLLMHNAVFDCAMADRYFKVSLMSSIHTDTMVLAHLLNENRRVGLKDLGSDLLGQDVTQEQYEMKASVMANGGKLTKSEYEMYKTDSQLMGKYGAKDAWLTFKLFHLFLPQLVDQGLDKFFYEDESMPLLRGPTYELNTVGLKVDQTALASLKKTLEAECLEARAFVYKEIDSRIKDKYPGTNKKNSFNIGSSSQLSWLLFGSYGLEFGTLTKEGKNICKALGMRIPYTATAKRDFIHICQSHAGKIYKPGMLVNGKVKGAKKYREPWYYIACDKKTLSKLAPKYKWIEKLLEYQRKTKILKTYVKGIEKRIQYGIIQPSFLQHGTTSGRYSSRNPNFQNLPRDDKRVKSCIVSRPGKVFVGADYSQLEPRVFAYTSGDKTLLDVFAGTEDFYSRIGMEVYGKYDAAPQKDGSPDAFGIKYKKLRDLSKVIALASTYGATAHQLAPTTGKSIEDTQEDINSYFERFPNVKQFMLDSHELAKTQGFVVNEFGRPRRMPDAMRINKLYGRKEHAELPYEARNILNLAVNHRIQSTGASIVNRSAIAFHEMAKQANIDCKLVMQVHDSLVIECNEADAEDVVVLLQHAMENTVQLEGLRLEAVPKIGHNLSEV